MPLKADTGKGAEASRFQPLVGLRLFFVCLVEGMLILRLTSYLLAYHSAQARCLRRRR